MFFGNQAEEYNIGWETYANNSKGEKEKENDILQLALLEPMPLLKKVQ